MSPVYGTTSQQHVPIPSLGRMMVFIDGENLVFRYQDMLKKGRKPHNNVIHKPNTYVWQPSSVSPGLNHVIRATYYTYVSGDENHIRKINEEIKDLTFNQYNDPYVRHTTMLLNNLYPCVFKKVRNKKAKGVDIQLTVDILTNVYMNNIESVYLITGDGDCKPVIQESIRHGKHVYIAALSSGLNEELKYFADNFIDLDRYYFQPEE